MAATAIGRISVHEAYSLEQLATMFNRNRDWARDTFIRPTDHKTRKRRTDKDGNPVPGVYHFRDGSLYLIPGQALMAWLMEHGSQVTDDQIPD